MVLLMTESPRARAPLIPPPPRGRPHVVGFAMTALLALAPRAVSGPCSCRRLPTTLASLDGALERGLRRETKLAEREQLARDRQLERQQLLDVAEADVLATELTLNQAIVALEQALALPWDDPGKDLAVDAAEQDVSAAESSVKLALRRRKAAQRRLQRADRRLARAAERSASARSWTWRLDQGLDALAAPFGFDAWRTVEFELHVADEHGDPLRGARVLVSPPAPRKRTLKALSKALGDSGRCILAQTTSGVDGVARLRARIPQERCCVDIVLQSAGCSGPYDQPRLRKLWGPMAPAARIHAPLEGLVTRAITLSELDATP